MKKDLSDLKFWRWLTALWTIVAMGLFILDFISGHKYNVTTSSVGIIYITVLTLFVGNKEFSRWYRTHQSTFFGEIFIVVWTILMMCLVIIAPLSKGKYRISGDIIGVYTAVLTIFLISRKSKALSEKRK